MKNKICLVAGLFMAIGLVAQGPMLNGLRTGFWTERSDGPNRNFVCKGNYKIVPLSQYDTIETINERLIEVRYKKGTPLVVFQAKRKGDLVVKDSVWNTYDKTGGIREQEYWRDGILLWSKTFDEKGRLVEEMIEDFDRDIRYAHQYISGRLYKKEYFLPENKNKLVEEYYPNEALQIPVAYQFFSVDFLSRPSAANIVQLKAKQPVTITAISSGLSFVHCSLASGEPLQFPIRLTKDSSIGIKISAAPDPVTYRSRDTIRIRTAASDSPYVILCAIFAAHFDAHTIKELNQMQLSKSTDRFLIVSPMGSYTDACIVSSSGEKFWYTIEGFTRIDLASFPSGNYTMIVSGCNDGGELRLVIKE